MPKTISEFIQVAHHNAIDKGWYEEPRSFGDAISLMHSELSEALEDHRNGRGYREVWYELKEGDEIAYSDRQLFPHCKPCGIPSELADVVIRIFDFCGHARIDLETAIREKMAYNATRPRRHGGKVL